MWLSFLLAVQIMFNPQAAGSKHKQLILVEAADESTIYATLKMYDKVGKKWVLNGSPIPVVLGRTGLAWGKGAYKIDTDGDAVKKEGDGKSPAGIFALSSVFGTAPKPKWMHMPYTRTDEQLYCVDDVKSKKYNKVVSTKKRSKDWNSAEDMLRPNDDLYKWGIVVGHNTWKPEPGGGSCIFMHIWKGNDKPTAGCTAMTEQNITTVLKWLRHDKHPVLVQGSKAQLKGIGEVMKLP